MTHLIALVATAADVVAASAGGARRVAVRVGGTDLPPEADLTHLSAVGSAAADARCAVSLWLHGTRVDPAAAVAACGADEVWGTLAAGRQPDVAHWAVVAADGAEEAELPLNCAGRVVSGGDGPPRLLRAVAVEQLERRLRQARAGGLAVRLFGSMEAPDVPRLLALGPDALVGGDLLRSGGVLDAGKVRVALELLTPRTSSVPGAEPVVIAGEPDRIFVRDWTLPLRLGAYGHEQAPQRVRFTVEVEVARPTGRAADMRDVVTYDLITDAIARATVTHVALVETIAEDVAALLLTHPRVMVVDITVEKLDLGPGSLGCRIRRRGAPP